jgi:Fe-S cluster assembly protein SufB
MSDKQNEQLPSSEYQFGFHDEDVSLYKTKKGITREIVEEISKIKGEPEWLLEFRLKSFEQFMQKKMPTWELIYLS